MPDIPDLIRRARETAASDRKWTTAPPRDDLLDELADALEQTAKERAGHHGAANRLVRDLDEANARAEAALAAHAEMPSAALQEPSNATPGARQQ